MLCPMRAVFLTFSTCAAALATSTLVAAQETPRPTTIAGDVYLGPAFAEPFGVQYGVAATFRHHFFEVGGNVAQTAGAAILGPRDEVRDLSALAGLVATRDDFVVFELLAETGSRAYLGAEPNGHEDRHAWFAGGRVGVSWRFPPRRIVDFGVWCWMNWDVSGAPAPTENDPNATTRGKVRLGFAFRVGFDADL